MPWTPAFPVENPLPLYLESGRIVLPIPSGSKKTAEPGWQDPSRKEFLIPPGANIAWRLDDLVDLDLDCPEAVLMAPKILPATPARSGRPSAHGPSHWFYSADEVAYEKFDDPAGGTLLELRTGSGHYTIVPPSLLPEARGLPSEHSAWAAGVANPIKAHGPTLRRQAALLATACLLARGLGKYGFGHEARLEVAGFLLRRGLTEDEAIAVGLAISDPTENTETDDVAITVRTTRSRLTGEHKKVAGGPALIKRMGEYGRERIAAIAKWLGGALEEFAFPEGIPPLTESGDAEKFASINADVVRYDWRRGRWLLFDGQGWRPQSDGEIDRLALEAIRARQAEAVSLSNDDARRAALKWAISGEARARRGNLLELAKSVRPLADNGENWDLDPWLLGTPNGVVDLRTGEMRQGVPEDRITMRTRAIWDPNAVCPLWDETISQVFGGDQELIDYFDRFIGYSLTGDCSEEVLAVCFGAGANGKGTLMNTLAWVLGEYADDLPFSAFELGARAGIPNDIAKIVGKRFVTSSETGETARLNEARVKALTGRDPITARFLHKEFFTFQPVAKFWLATNHKPEVRDDSVGFWRRIRLIPFEQSFSGREDKRLKERLREELPGILARAARGTREWLKHGLKPPKSATSATDEWREESDLLAPFIEERCIVKDEGRVRASTLYSAYLWWHRDRGIREKPMSQKAFGLRVRRQFSVDERRSVVYCGLALIDNTRGDSEEENM